MGRGDFLDEDNNHKKIQNYRIPTYYFVERVRREETLKII